MVSIILLTGFKPYSNIKRNPSGEIAELFDGSYFKGSEVVGLSLEMTNSDIEKTYLDELKKGYDVIINTCLSPGRKAVGLEKIAINWMNGESDGIFPSRKPGKIVQDAPDGLFSRLPIEGILHAMRSAKIPSEISYCPGTSPCNQIFYYSLYYSTANAGLIHFPLDSETSLNGKYPTMSIDNMIRSVEITIQQTL